MTPRLVVGWRAELQAQVGAEAAGVGGRAWRDQQRNWQCLSSAQRMLELERQRARESEVPDAN